MSPRFADVIPPLPVDGTYTYTLPAELSSRVRVGCRVIVPFGARRFYSAIVLRLHDEEPSYPTKEVMELLDSEPVVLPQQLRLWQWIADYYLCTLAEVSRAALPGGLRLESESRVTLAPDFVPTTQLTPNEQRLISLLADTTHMQIGQLQKESSIRNILTPVKHLLDMGAIVMHEEVRRTYKPKTIACVRLSEDYFDESQLALVTQTLRRSPAQARLLQTYAQLSQLASALAMRDMQMLHEVTRQQLLAATGSTPATLNNLRSRGILKEYLKNVSRHDISDETAQAPTPQLSPTQQQALDDIHRQWQDHSVCLLHGVTGSGKTEIYIHLIQEALDRGQQVLYMLPEIALTVQLTERLRRVFGNRLGVFHSRYPDAERVEVYQKQLTSTPYDIIVGVRSSVFLPFQRLGLLIIDEEHETSYKQQEPAPRYHARNAALVLAAQVGARALLGTATPSLESYHNAQTGKYGLVTLSTRFGHAILPRIQVVDTAEARRKKLMRGPLSPQLREQIGQALEHNQQVILFQNRRGYAPMLECNPCGWVPRCTRCDVTLTLHRSQHALTCHYCGATYPIPIVCPNCQSREFRTIGYGTERIEDCLHELFPQARIARMDLDTTRTRTAYEQLLTDFQQGHTDILVGTQMVAKGLDFQHVTLVGILSANTLLSMPDFRSHERAFQMMEQVAGRAGRHSQPGTVILQTTDPEDPVIDQVVRHDYQAMYDTQMEERQLFNYPPNCRIIYVFLKHRDAATVQRLADEAAAQMQRIFGPRALGPHTPAVARIQQMHIRQILLKIELQASMKEVRLRLRQLQANLLAQPAYKTAQIYYDVD